MYSKFKIGLIDNSINIIKQSLFNIDIINSKIESNSKTDLEYNDIIDTIEEIIKSKNTKMFCMKESERNKETCYKKFCKLS